MDYVSREETGIKALWTCSITFKLRPQTRQRRVGHVFYTRDASHACSLFTINVSLDLVVGLLYEH